MRVVEPSTTTTARDLQRDRAAEPEALADAVTAARAALRRRIGAEFVLAGTPGTPDCRSFSFGATVALTGEAANFNYAVVGDAEAATWLAKRVFDLGPEDGATPSELADALNEISDVAAGMWKARRGEVGERYQRGMPLFLRGSSWLRFFSKGVQAVSQRLAGPEGVVLQVVLVWQTGVKPGGVPLPMARTSSASSRAADLPGEVLQEATRAVVDICEIQMGLKLEIDAKPGDPRGAAITCGSSIALTTEAGGGWNLAVMGCKDSCESMTRILFAMDADEEPALEDLADGVGEIANVAAGVFRTSRLAAGQRLQIGLPLYLEGRGCIDVFSSGRQGLSQSLEGPDGIVIHVIITWQEGRP